MRQPAGGTTKRLTRLRGRCIVGLLLVGGGNFVKLLQQVVKHPIVRNRKVAREAGA